MIRTMFILILLMPWTGSLAANDSVRCGSKIMKIGMSMDEILKYCGEPTSRETEDHDVRSGNRVTGTTQLHIWTYQRGASQAPAVLEFDVEKLISISTRKR
jgi:hypothetical protein